MCAGSMRFSTLSSVLAVVHGVGASLSQVSAKDALKQGSASRVLASYQKYTDELVDAYLKRQEPVTEDAAKGAIAVIEQFMQEMHEEHDQEHKDDLQVGPQCLANMKRCAEHLDDNALKNMDAMNASEHKYRGLHKECRDAQAHGCASSHDGVGWAQEHYEPNTCALYDQYRQETRAARLPACAKKQSKAYALSSPQIQANEMTTAGGAELDDMENCLEAMQAWLLDGLKKRDGELAELYPGPPGLYPRMEECTGGKQCCDDAAFCEPFVSNSPAAEEKFCDKLQLQFEEAHCQYEVTRDMACKFFNNCRDDEDTNCNTQCDAVKIRVAGRKADNETMERIGCLLTVLMDTEEKDKPAKLEECKTHDYTEMLEYWNIDGCPPGSPDGIAIAGDVHCRAPEELTCFSAFKEREYLSTWDASILATCKYCDAQVDRLEQAE